MLLIQKKFNEAANGIESPSEFKNQNTARKLNKTKKDHIQIIKPNLLAAKVRMRWRERPSSSTPVTLLIKSIAVSCWLAYCWCKVSWLQETKGKSKWYLSSYKRGIQIKRINSFSSTKIIANEQTHYSVHKINKMKTQAVISKLSENSDSNRVQVNLLGHAIVSSFCTD